MGKATTLAAFQTYDGNNDGKISKAELKSVLSRRLSSYGRSGRLAAEDMDHLVDQFDSDGDGALDMQEFAVALSQSPELRAGTSQAADAVLNKERGDELLSLRAEVARLKAELAGLQSRVSAKPEEVGEGSTSAPQKTNSTEETEAAIKLQAFHRGKMARKRVERLKIDTVVRLKVKILKAAIRIQSITRGRQARKITCAADDKAMAVGAKLHDQEVKAIRHQQEWLANAEWSVTRGHVNHPTPGRAKEDAPRRARPTAASVVEMASAASDKLKAAIDEDGDGHVMMHEVRRAVQRQVHRKALLTVAILKGRARRWLRRNEMVLAVISVLYLGRMPEWDSNPRLAVVFMQIVMEEVPLSPRAEEDALQIFASIDLVFLIIFSVEIVASLVAYGLKYFAPTLVKVDAATVVTSLVIASLERAGVINTRLEIMRLFRLLRLLKVAIALQRVRLRTSNWRKMSMEATRQPPTCNWARARRYDPNTGKKIRHPPPAKKYAAFLSHYKLEAGADARYLEQELELMLNHNVFTDSNDLTNLANIFSKGILESEVIILLGTKGVLSRPWCLLELYEARKHGIPVLTFAMSAHGFTPAVARAQVSDLHNSLPGAALNIILEHLDKAGDTYEHFVELLLEAVDPDGPGSEGEEPLFQEWDNMAVDAQVKVEVKGLIHSMSLVTHRSLTWSDSLEDYGDEVAVDASRSCKDYLLCRKPRGGHVQVLFERGGNSAAHVLQAGLRKQLGKPVLLSGQWDAAYGELRDAASADEKEREATLAMVAEQLDDAVEEGVHGASCVVVLLTERLLSDPFTLIEMYEAFMRSVNVVPVHVKGGGYDFAAAIAQLDALPSLLEAADPELFEAVLDLMASRGIALSKMQTTLKHLPDIIAVEMQLSKSADSSVRKGAECSASASPAAAPDGKEAGPAQAPAPAIAARQTSAKGHFHEKAFIAAVAARCQGDR